MGITVEKLESTITLRDKRLEPHERAPLAMTDVAVLVENLSKRYGIGALQRRRDTCACVRCKSCELRIGERVRGCGVRNLQNSTSMAIDADELSRKLRLFLNRNMDSASQRDKVGIKRASDDSRMRGLLVM